MNSSTTQAVAQPTLEMAAGEVCRILLIRHGRSDDVVPGSPESADPPLHPIGVQQAVAIGQRLAGTALHAVYSSHLLRAYNTAIAIATHHGLSVGISEDLEEIKLGDWGHGEFRRRAAIADPEFVEWATHGTWDGIPGGEGDTVFRTRVTKAVNAIANQHLGQTVAVVAHGGVINAYIAKMMEASRTMWFTIENTSITIVKVGTTTSSIQTINDCQHLYDQVTL
ncbi:MAG: histidine phosphatase family protein [Ilumatobacteraceae bacterium]|nr:histidine phosphatase family protein [Ilumatobacteraceae bacterium]